MGIKAIHKAERGPLYRDRRLRAKAKTFRAALLRWARRHGRTFPWRETDDPYRTLIAELMLQRTRSTQVAPVFEEFVGQYPSIATLADAPSKKVREVLRPLGLAFRARTFIELARVVREDHNGAIPLRAEEAIKLPGTGPYAASALDAFLGGRRLPLIDANIARVISRVFGIGRPDWRYATATERRDLYEIAAICIGRAIPREYHYALLDFAALICTARRPACPECPMHKAQICTFCAEKIEAAGPPKR